MRTLLIGINAKYIHPALAIYQLKANTSCEVRIYETTIKEPIENIYQTILEFIDEGISHLAFSVYLWNIEIILDLLKKLKTKSPNLIITAGGPEVGYEVETFLKMKFKDIYLFDFIMRGEGEKAFDELCLYLEGKLQLNDVSNIAYRNGEQIIYNTLGYPNLKDLNIAIFDVPNYKNRVIYLESSRGCPFHCSYCTASLENKVRYFPKDKIINLLKRLMEEKVKIVKFLDRTFNANKDFMFEILKTIKNYNKSTIFQFEVVGDLLTPEVIDLLKTLPRKYLRFEIGIQSTNPTVNLAINRKQDMAKLKQNIELLLETKKVDLHVDLIAGLPYEDLNGFKQSFNDAFNLHPTELQLGFLKFLRGTKMLDLVKQHQYVYDNKAPYEIIRNAYLSETDLSEIHLVEDALDKFYNSNKLSKTFNYLFDKINMPYDFFLYLAKSSSSINSLNRQLCDLYCDFDVYLKTLYDDYDYLHFLIKQDYLHYVKVRPKIWWNESLDKAKKKEVFGQFIEYYPDLSYELLYRYGLVISYQDEYLVALYQNYQPSFYYLKKMS